MRNKIILVCPECFSRNYITSKNKITQKEKFEISKFCKICKKHTKHKETR